MINMILFLQSFSSPPLDDLFLLVSSLTSEFIYLAVLGVLYWCVNKDKAYYIGIFLFLSLAVNSALKNTFKIPRPYTYSEVKQIDARTGYGYSFPSGHAQLSTTFSGMFSVIFRKKWIYISGIILVFLTGLSRMYLGVHTIVDILCGIAIGLIITFIGDQLKNTKSVKLIALISFLILLVFSLIFHNEDDLKLLFFAMGFLSGNLIEEKFINFKIPKLKKMKIIGGILGFSLTILLNILLKSFGLFYVRYLILGLFMTIAVPYIITKINRR